MKATAAIFFALLAAGVAEAQTKDSSNSNAIRVHRCRSAQQ